MSILGYNHHLERLNSLINESHSILESLDLNEATQVKDSNQDLTNGNGIEKNKKQDKDRLKVILNDAKSVINGLEPYVEKCTNLPNPKLESTKVLKEMISETNQTDWTKLFETNQTQIKLMSEMSSNSYEHGLIKFLCDLIKPKRILEIGMFTGTMTLIFSLTKGIEKVVSLEYEPFLEEWCRTFWKRLDGGKVSEKIEVRIGSAFDSLEKMKVEGEEAFDMILIDADKSSYSKYFNQIINHKLLSKNGILLIDNTIYKATTFSPFSSNLINDSLKLNVNEDSIQQINQNGQSLNDLNQEISNHSEVDVVMLPIRDGLSLIKWKEV